MNGASRSILNCNPSALIRIPDYSFPLSCPEPPQHCIGNRCCSVAGLASCVCVSVCVCACVCVCVGVVCVYVCADVCVDVCVCVCLCMRVCVSECVCVCRCVNVCVYVSALVSGCVRVFCNCVIGVLAGALVSYNKFLIASQLPTSPATIERTHDHDSR
jgi:hypothetical protein